MPSSQMTCWWLQLPLHQVIGTIKCSLQGLERSLLRLHGACLLPGLRIPRAQYLFKLLILSPMPWVSSISVL